jgi:hypothetical protein
MAGEVGLGLGVVPAAVMMICADEPKLCAVELAVDAEEPAAAAT